MIAGLAASELPQLAAKWQRGAQVLVLVGYAAPHLSL
jgi:hypothetical protein